MSGVIDDLTYALCVKDAQIATLKERLPEAVEALVAELRNWGHGEGCTVDADDDPETCSCYHKYLARLDALRGESDE